MPETEKGQPAPTLEEVMALLKEGVETFQGKDYEYKALLAKLRKEIEEAISDAVTCVKNAKHAEDKNMKLYLAIRRASAGIECRSEFSLYYYNVGRPVSISASERESIKPFPFSPELYTRISEYRIARYTGDPTQVNENCLTLMDNSQIRRKATINVFWLEDTKGTLIYMLPHAHMDGGKIVISSLTFCEVHVRTPEEEAARERDELGLDKFYGRK